MGERQISFFPEEDFSDVRGGGEEYPIPVLPKLTSTATSCLWTGCSGPPAPSLPMCHPDCKPPPKLWSDHRQAQGTSLGCLGMPSCSIPQGVGCRMVCHPESTLPPKFFDSTPIHPQSPPITQRPHPHHPAQHISTHHSTPPPHPPPRVAPMPHEGMDTQYTHHGHKVVDGEADDVLATRRTERGNAQAAVVMCPRWGSDPASGHPGAQKPPLGRDPPPPVWGVHLDVPGQQ